MKSALNLLRAGLTVTACLLSAAVTAQTISLDNVPPFALSTSTSLAAVSIDTSNGSVVVRSSAGNLNQCRNTGGGGGSPAVTSFGPNTSSVAPSSNFSLTWSSTNTTSCSPQLGTGTIWASLGTLGPSGTQILTAPATQGTIQFQITCTNGSTNAVATTSIIVQTGGSSCTPPTGTTGNSANWNTSLGTVWPSYNDVLRQMIDTNTWLALSFTASTSSTQFGTMSTSGFPGDGGGLGQISVSSSPGCFNQAQLGANCLSPIVEYPGVSWSNQASAFACKLTPGVTYQMNFWFPSCPGLSCGRDFGNIQQLLQAPPTLNR